MMKTIKIIKIMRLKDFIECTTTKNITTFDLVHNLITKIMIYTEKQQKA